MSKKFLKPCLLSLAVLLVSVTLFNLNIVKTYAATWTQQFTDNFARSNGAIGNGWIDTSNVATIVSNTLNLAYGGSGSPWHFAIFRPSSENTLNQRMVTDSTSGNTQANSTGLFTLIRAVDNQNFYWAGIYSGNLYMGKVVGDTQSDFGQVAMSPAFNSSHAYRIDFSASGTSPTTLTGILIDLTASTTVATSTYTDSESVLQVAGKTGMYMYTTGGVPWLMSNVTIYNSSTSTVPATSYTFTGPSSVSVSQASSNFTVTPNGTYNGAITVSDGSAGGTFSTTTLTFASSSVAKTFTYTPSTVGTKTISVTSSPALTNPSSISLSVTDPNAGRVGVTNSNLIWSPYTWKFNGTTSAQTSPGGAYVKIAFTGSTLGINIDSSMLGGISPSSMVLHAYVDGTSTPISKTFADASANQIVFTNTLTSGNHYAVIYLSSTPFSVDRWTGPADLLKITSLQLSSTGTPLSLAGTPLALKPRKVLFFGDSISEGYLTSGAEYAYTAVIAKQLGNAEYGQVAYSGAGWNQQAPNNVPYFYDSTATSTSFWRNFDASTSRLVNNSNLSSGFIDGAPNAVYLNMGINDANAGSSAAAIRAKMTSWLTEIRTVVGSSPAVFVVVPFNFGSGSFAAYKTAYIGGISDYQAAHPSDTRVYLIDLGASAYTTVQNNSSDNLHPNDAGDLILATSISATSSPFIISQVTALSAITATPSSTTTAVITWTTDQNADTQLRYGTSTVYTATTTLNTTQATSHTVNLSNLLENTLYHYQVISKDLSNTILTSSDQTFTTLATVVVSTSTPTTTPVTTHSSSGSSSHRHSGGGSSTSASVTTTTTPSSTTVTTTTTVTSLSTPDAGCLSGYLFSATTGQKCSTTVSGSTSSPAVSSTSTYTFTRNLTVGMTGDDVKQLQMYLNTHGFTVASSGPGSLGNETTMFGNATKAALIKFQQAHAITPSVGYFGVVTRGSVK